MIMRRELLNICGPFSVYSYGVAMALGILVFMWFCQRHPWRKAIISQEKFIEIVCVSLFIGLGGARLLFVLNSWNRFSSVYEMLAIWDGGFSFLGGIIAILCFLPIYLKIIKVPALQLFDLAALHASLLHAISRLGCFMAGCCYGQQTNVFWAITYTDPHSDAPLNVPLHPTQLYMSFTLLGVFLFFYFFVQKKVRYTGQLLMLYLITESIIRFSIDYFRADLEYFSFDTHHVFSVHQWISLAILTCSILGLALVTKKKLPIIQS